jgi:hypothetical protein
VCPEACGDRDTPEEEAAGPMEAGWEIGKSILEVLAHGVYCAMGSEDGRRYEGGGVRGDAGGSG